MPDAVRARESVRHVPGSAPAAKTSVRLALTASAGSTCQFRGTRSGALPTLTNTLLALAPASAGTGVAMARASSMVAMAMTTVPFMASPFTKAFSSSTPRR
jgi:hypothetical protein